MRRMPAFAIAAALFVSANTTAQTAPFPSDDKTYVIKSGKFDNVTGQFIADDAANDDR